MNHEFRESVTPRCPPGYILRKSYTTKNGTFVPARCIVERGIFPKNMQNENQKKMKNVEKNIKKMCKNKKCPVNCPKGEILREGYLRNAYTKEDGTHVNATLVAPECIKNRGAPGKGPQLIKIDDVDHILSDHGYSGVKDKSIKERRALLMKVIRAVAKDYGKRQAMIYVIKALTARATLTKTGSPESSKAFTEDHEWVSSLLADWKDKHVDEKKDKKKARLILLGPTDHILSTHGYQNISGLDVEKRHSILRKVLADLAKLKGEAEAYKTLIKELVARSNLGMTKSPEASKLMKRDADWVSELYAEFKGKRVSDKKKTGPIKLDPKVHVLSMHGYENVVNIPVEKRHKILWKVIRFLGKEEGDLRIGFRKVIEQLNAVSILQRTNDPASSKIFKADADWVSETYKNWKEKDGKKKKEKIELKEKKANNGKLKLLNEKKKGQKIKLMPINVPKSALIEKIEKITRKNQSKK